MSDQGPGQILFEFVRHWARRPDAGNFGTAEQGRLVVVSEAVNTLGKRGQPATVNAVAFALGVDQSGASRLLTSAVQAGYVSMSPSPSDGRQRVAEMTDTGRRAIDRAHQWQEQVFDQLTEGWSDARRDEFRRAMLDLMSRSLDLGFTT